MISKIINEKLIEKIINEFFIFYTKIIILLLNHYGKLVIYVMLASELKQSKESFESGVNLIHEKKYIKAINDFKNVKDSDKKRYDQAQEKIKEASNLYRR